METSCIWESEDKDDTYMNCMDADDKRLPPYLEWQIGWDSLEHFCLMLGRKFIKKRIELEIVDNVLENQIHEKRD